MHEITWLESADLTCHQFIVSFTRECGQNHEGSMNMQLRAPILLQYFLGVVADIDTRHTHFARKVAPELRS